MASQGISAFVSDEAASGKTSRASHVDASADELSQTSLLATSLRASKPPRRSIIHTGRTRHTSRLSPSYVWTLKAVAVLLVLVLTKYYVARYVKCLRRVLSSDTETLPRAGEGVRLGLNVPRRLVGGGTYRYHRLKNWEEVCEEEVRDEINVEEDVRIDIPEEETLLPEPSTFNPELCTGRYCVMWTNLLHAGLAVSLVWVLTSAVAFYAFDGGSRAWWGMVLADATGAFFLLAFLVQSILESVLRRRPEHTSTAHQA